MTGYLLDTSVLLAILQAERGHEAALEQSMGGLISAVHLSETVAKADDYGIRRVDVLGLTAQLGLTVLPFDEEDALAAAALKPLVRSRGILFADRACLGVGLRRGLPIVTGDHDWATLGLDATIIIFRDYRPR